MAHCEPPHQDLRYLQIQLFSSLELLRVNRISNEVWSEKHIKLAKACIQDILLRLPVTNGILRYQVCNSCLLLSHHRQLLLYILMCKQTVVGLKYNIINENFPWSTEIACRNNANQIITDNMHLCWNKSTFHAEINFPIVKIRCFIRGRDCFT